MIEVNVKGEDGGGGFIVDGAYTMVENRTKMGRGAFGM